MNDLTLQLGATEALGFVDKPASPPAPTGTVSSTAPESNRSSAVAPDMLIDGRYRALRLLGIGGMGEVWEVEHIHIGRRFALKTLVRRDGTQLAGDAVKRLIREAQVLGTIDDHHVVSVTDFGQLGDRTPYCVMELLDGESLHAKLRNDGPIPWPTAVRWLRGIAAGLEAAHRAGIIHRDLKPSNIFVVGHGSNTTVKIIDFGIARPTELAAGAQKLTHTGVLFGTPAYVSPEQALGEPVDARTDIYSLGCVAYEMLTGLRPYPGETVEELLHGHLFCDPSPVASEDIPVWLQSVLLQCLEKQPEARISSASELLNALQDPSNVQKPTVSGRVKWLVGLGSVAIAASALAAVLMQPSPIPLESHHVLSNERAWTLARPHLPSPTLAGTMRLKAPTPVSSSSDHVRPRHRHLASQGSNTDPREPEPQPQVENSSATEPVVVEIPVLENGIYRFPVD